MPSLSLSKFAIATIATIGLVACAAPAPDLPRYVNRSNEPNHSDLPTAPSVNTGRKIALITRPSWDSLTIEDRTTIQQKYTVDLRDPAAYAMIIDNQGVNESAPSTNGGAILGGAVANAAYIDRSFKPGNNYSAISQLTVGLLGAVVGSALDKPAVSQFHFRYALKRYDGEIVYRDSVQGDSFRHPIGMCLDLVTLLPASQMLCAQTAADVRKAYLVINSTEVMAVTQQSVVAPSQESTVIPSALGRVDCKLGNLAPVSTTPEKCQSIGGKPL